MSTLISKAQISDKTKLLTEPLTPISRVHISVPNRITLNQLNMYQDGLKLQTMCRITHPGYNNTLVPHME